MSSTNNYFNDLKLPLPDDYFPRIFFIRKKKYTAHLINKDGLFTDKTTKDNQLTVRKGCMIKY